ncbi:hypothetical protein A1Q2_02366 [Trichosporon asahii var. asahii CBS 8904]|uniref:AB hydrolase-1 domain-containing protein n=1 Tax=Trichosporon asahii var. asahii (strain CBS 8904) TaxID=1220162 RepID=K1VV05_TRIAC|nr:hypothetical protein A1Q2_02366 [Trichosporon asahii var. asahii CBS 8904]
MLRTLPRLLPKPASYARPTTLRGSTGLTPRSLLPLLQHPNQSTAPQQPPRPVLPTPSGWSSTLHAAPAAYPRSLASAIGTNARDSHPFATASAAGNAQPVKESKEERNKRLALEKDRCIAARHDSPVWPFDTALKAEHHPLWIAAERWVNSTQAPDGLTIITTHACGFSKESWRPVFAKLFPLLEAGAESGAAFGTGERLPGDAPHINEIWFLEDTNHGVSVDLNKGRLGDALCWDDSARELINFVENVLPAVGDEADEAGFQLPFELGGKSAQQAGKTPADGLKRKVVGIGHSYGGNALAQAAASRPDLFDAILLVEPMTVPSLVNAGESGSPLTMGALKRRSEWPSLAEAGNVRSNALFSRWEEEQFRIWLSHYLVPSPSGGMELATPTWAEAQTFSEPDAPMRGWECLPDLGMPVGFLMAGDETWMTGEEVAQELVWRPQRARNERILDASHLVIQEKPAETAASIGRFLRTLPSWDERPQK